MVMVATAIWRAGAVYNVPVDSEADREAFANLDTPTELQARVSDFDR